MSPDSAEKQLISPQTTDYVRFTYLVVVGVWILGSDLLTLSVAAVRHDINQWLLVGAPTLHGVMNLSNVIVSVEILGGKDRSAQRCGLMSKCAALQKPTDLRVRPHACCVCFFKGTMYS